MNTSVKRKTDRIGFTEYSIYNLVERVAGNNRLEGYVAWAGRINPRRKQCELAGRSGHVLPCEMVSGSEIKSECTFHLLSNPLLNRL